MKKIETGSQLDMKLVNPGATAIDIGWTIHMAAVTPGNSDTPVRAFGTFNGDLHDLADWVGSSGQYIDGFYNPRRRHSALGYKSPITFEVMTAKTKRMSLH